MLSNTLPELSQQRFSSSTPERKANLTRHSKYSLTAADRNLLEAQHAQQMAERVARSGKRAPTTSLNFTGKKFSNNLSSSARLSRHQQHHYANTAHFSQTLPPSIPPPPQLSKESEYSNELVKSKMINEELRNNQEHTSTFIQQRKLEYNVCNDLNNNGCVNNEFSLTPLRSIVAAEKAEVAEKWRSDLLHCETDLRELVIQNNGKPPSLPRILHAVSLFDKVTEVSANYSEVLYNMLRLFRSEFCHAIFCESDLNERLEEKLSCIEKSDNEFRWDDNKNFITTNQVRNNNNTNKNLENNCVDRESKVCDCNRNVFTLFNNDKTFSTKRSIKESDVGAYFDQVHILRRENAHLQDEVNLGNTRETMVELRKKIKEYEDTITMYESEVHRLSRQTDSAVEQYCRTRDELYDVKMHASEEQEKADRALQTLNVENKDLQLQLFRLRKQVAGGKAKLLHDSYRQLKLSKMDMMTTLFSEGDERINILVMLSQLESRLNEILDSYDNEFVLTFDSTIIINANNVHNSQSLTITNRTTINHEQDKDNNSHSSSNNNKNNTNKKSNTSRNINTDNGFNGSRQLELGNNSHVVETSKSYASHLELRRQMGTNVSVILEEMLYCAYNYRRLVPQCSEDNEQGEKTDETDGFVAVLFDERIYHNLLAREVLRKRMEETEIIAQLSPFDDTININNDSLADEQKRGNDCLDKKDGNEMINNNNKGNFTEVEQRNQLTESNELETNKSANRNVVGEHERNAHTKEQQEYEQEQHEQEELLLDLEHDKENNSNIDCNNNRRNREEKLIAEVKAKAKAAWRSSFDIRNKTLEEIVKHRREEWLRNIFRIEDNNNSNNNNTITSSRNDAVGADTRTTAKMLFSSPIRGINVRNAPETTSSCTAMLSKLLANPLKDLCGDKFNNGVDVYVGNDPLQQRYLCTVNYIDPASSIAMPEPVNYVKIKSKNMMRAQMQYASRENNAQRNSGYSPAPLTSNIIINNKNNINSSDHKNNGSDSYQRCQVRRSTQSSNEIDLKDMKRAMEKEEVIHALDKNITCNTGNTNNSTTTMVKVSSNVERKSSAAIARCLNEWGATSSFVPEFATEHRRNNHNESFEWEQREESPYYNIQIRNAKNNNREGEIESVQASSAAEVQKQRQTVFQVHQNLRIFHELSASTLWDDVSNKETRAGATSSTTAMTVALQRLNPLSPNRNPEWTLYKALFNGYRSLTPRMLEVTTIDHILLGACERYFRRMEFRYGQCRAHAQQRSSNYQMLNSIAERLFREQYELSDFQEGLVDELESRYGFPELVAKTMYEMLCYLDAMASRDALLRLYLSVIRGFVPATYIHYICYTLYHLSFSWPASNPVEEVAREDVMTVLGHMYRNTDRIVHVEVREVMKDFDLATRGATLSLITMREYLSTIMLHHEEPVLLYFNGLITSHCGVGNANEITFENYLQVISKLWPVTNESRSFVRFMISGSGLNRTSLQSAKDLSYVAASSWCSNLWM